LLRAAVSSRRVGPKLSFDHRYRLADLCLADLDLPSDTEDSEEESGEGQEDD
jgi:hypothetical protein